MKASSEIDLATFVEDGPLQKAVENYLSYFAANSSHTARAKKLDLSAFLSSLSEQRKKRTGDLRVRDWDHSSVQTFLEHCLRRGEAPATVARRLATLKHMGRTLAERIPGFINPAREVKAPKLPMLRPKGLSSRKVEAVRDYARRRFAERPSFNRFRNQVLFEFLLDTGIRADEVRLLRMSQLDPELEWVKNVRTKGRRFRNVYVTSKLRPLLKEYLAERVKELARFFPKLPMNVDHKLPLFISTYGAAAGMPDSFLMGAKTIWRAIRELSGERELHPHLLRHSFALDLLNESNDVRLVAQALGHSDVRITMRYTERAEAEVAAALEKSRARKR